MSATCWRWPNCALSPTTRRPFLRAGRAGRCRWKPFDARGHRVALAAALRGRRPAQIAAAHRRVGSALRQLGVPPDPPTAILLRQAARWAGAGGNPSPVSVVLITAVRRGYRPARAYSAHPPLVFAGCRPGGTTGSVGAGSAMRASAWLVARGVRVEGVGVRRSRIARAIRGLGGSFDDPEIARRSRTSPSAGFWASRCWRSVSPPPWRG